MWKIQIVLITALWKISQGFFTLWKLSAFIPRNYIIFLTVTINIVNHLEHYIHIECTYLLGLQQILPQSAKFLPRACSRHSHNIPSLMPLKQNSQQEATLLTLLPTPTMVCPNKRKLRILYLSWD